MKLLMRSMIALLLRSILGIAALVIVLANVRLYVPSPLARTNDRAPRHLARQLAASRAALDAGTATEMQQLFPEGYYFSHLFYGLTWVELAMRDSTYEKRAIAEARRSLSCLESQEGSAPFPPGLPPNHGMFYSAWKAHLRAGVVMIQRPDTASEDLAVLRHECDALADAMERSETPFLPSYLGAAWPCDTLPAIHAMATYDRLTGETRYSELITDWLTKARQRFDPETGLFPHTASLPDGRDVGVARATSQVIILRLLPDIDAHLAASQYCTFRERFMTTFLGLPCVREYPSGIDGPGDVDSGPLIAGRSLSATVLMMGVAQIYGDRHWADAVAQTGELVGLPWTWDGKKRYMGGVLPLGDIMVGYAHVARPWFGGEAHCPTAPQPLSLFWRCGVHALSAFALLLIVLVLRRRKKPAADCNRGSLAVDQSAGGETNTSCAVAPSTGGTPTS